MKREHVSNSTGKLVIVIGPSGVGKSVILNTLREKHPTLHFPKSATTRERREGESLDLYHFVSESDFDQLIEENQVLEWAVVHGGARYGTLASEIIPYIDNGQTVVREVDVQGFDSIRNHRYFRGNNAPCNMTSVFILPEDKDQLIDRIQQRAPISDEELRRRIASMERELTYAELCDVQIVNKNGYLEETIVEVESVIFDH